MSAALHEVIRIAKAASYGIPANAPRIARAEQALAEIRQTLKEIHLQAADAQLRATYQRAALEQISAKAQAALAKVRP